MKKQKVFILKTTSQDINGTFEEGWIEAVFDSEDKAWQEAHEIAEEKGYLDGEIDKDIIQSIVEDEFEVSEWEIR